MEFSIVMNRWSLLLTLFLLWGEGAIPLAASDGTPSVPVSDNLISNSGFEEGMAPWVQDNFLKNDAVFQRDPENPHSGAYAMKVALKRTVGGPDIHFLYPHLPVRPDMALEIRFWARGVSNGTPLIVMIRKEAAPWTRYFEAETALTDDWHEYVYTARLPAATDPSVSSLLFALHDTGAFWIDDVSVRELPAVEGGEAATVNPVRNPSFEVGTDGWTANFRTRDFKVRAEEMGGDSPSPADAKLETRTDGTAPQGRRFLSFEVKPGCFTSLTSAYFPARYGHLSNLVFSLRSDGAHGFQAGVGGGKNSNATMQEKTLASTPQWQTYRVPLTLQPISNGLYYLRFEFEAPGRYELDAVSLMEADQTDALLYPPSVAIDVGEDAPVGHLYEPGQKAAFQLVIAGEKAETPLSYRIAVTDYLGRKIDEAKIDVITDDHGDASKSFELPTSLLGAFRIEARRDDAPGLLAEQLYSVLPPLPPPSERPDSYFGGHVDLTPYNLEIARKAGFRWLRFHPPLDTKWRVVEQSPGEWDFRTAGAAMARSLGFRILGSFDTTPDFAADIDPQNPIKTRWCRSYPPADLSAWKDYVVRCFNAFSPYIDAWEVWNEPDGTFLMVRPGVDKAGVYGSILQATREALDSTGKPSVLLGGAVSSINVPLGWQILDNGNGRFIDAFSFHFYSLHAGGNSPDVGFVLPLLDKYRSYKNQQAQPMPLWMTEGGVYLNGGQSWLQTYSIPASSTVTPPQGAAAMVRSALFFKAMGVKRYFDFQLWASASGRRGHEDICSSFIDVTGIPGPGIAAHAAMVALTEDPSAAGFETKSVNGIGVKVAHFKKDDQRVDVVWSDSPVPLTEAVPLQPEDQVLDMMGNPIAAQTAQLSEFPVYVRGKALAAP